MSIMYHDGNRQLQDRFDSRRIWPTGWKKS